MSRSRANVSGGELSAVLKPFVIKNGKRWLQYDSEEDNIMDSKLDKKAIDRHQDVIEAVYKFSKGRPLAKKTVEEAMQSLATECGGPWKLTGEQLEDWSTTMCRRFRNMMYQVLHAKDKSNPPAWVKKITFLFDEAGPEVDAASLDHDGEASAAGDGPKKRKQNEVSPGGPLMKRPSSSTTSDYFFGWHPELRLAWRCKSLDSALDRELSCPIKADPDAPPTSNIVATWPDGCEWVVATVTHRDFADLEKGRRGTGDEPIWQMTHSVNNNTLKLAQRPDRKLLLSLYEQTRQILQVHTGLFGPLPEPQPAVVPRTCEALVKAIEFMQPIAIAYAKNEISFEELGTVKKDKLRALGLMGGGGSGKKKGDEKSTSTSIKKRPAAAVAHPSSPKASDTKTPTPSDHTSSSASTSTGKAKKASAPSQPVWGITSQVPLSLEEEARTRLNMLGLGVL
jgi:hypothetical protein